MVTIRWYVLPRGRLQHVEINGDPLSSCGARLPDADDERRANATAIADEEGWPNLHSCGRCYRAAAKARRRDAGPEAHG